MKKILNEITDWTGWFFCEMSFRMWDWKFLYKDADSEDYKWFAHPIGWLAGVFYTTGCYFYGFALHERRRR